MDIPKYKIALIVGAGAGLSASLTRLFSREGIRVALGARSIEKLGALCTETSPPISSARCRVEWVPTPLSEVSGSKPRPSSATSTVTSPSR